MNRRVLGLTAALALTIFGTILLVAYVRGAEERALAGEQLVPVAVLTENVSAGTSADQLAGSVAIEQVPAKLRPDDSISSLDQLDELEGLVTETDLYDREELVLSRLTQPDVLGRIGIAVPDALLEVSVALDSQRTVGGTIAAGDYVAVIASFEFDASIAPTTEIILQKVLVTNVQLDKQPSPVDPTDEAPSVAVVPAGNLVVTLALLPDEVEALVHSQIFGNIWLARQQPDDATAVTADQIIRPQSIAEVMR